MPETINKKRIAKNSVLLYIRMLFTMWINLYATRLVLANLGVNDMGVYGVVDSYSSHPLSDDYTHIGLGGKMIPSVILVCNNCGFISQHALGTLGFLPQQNESNAEYKR